MLTLICLEIKNFFVKSDKDKHFGVFTIEEGALTSSFDLQDGQYFRIIGSTFNDGVHKYNDENDTLTDESFEGAIWVMRVPNDFLTLANEIEEYNSNNKTNAFNSESFGGYSYSKKEDDSWQKAFATKLNAFRKLV